MIFSEHLKLIPNSLHKTLKLNLSFNKLSLNIQNRIFIVGSGSSYSHSIFLREVLQSKLNNQIRVLNPYSFVRYNEVYPGDILIHITQEAKRNDNICPIEYAKKKGAKIILFTTKETEVSKLADEIYWYCAEHAKLLVACESYVSAYIPLLLWAEAQSHKNVEFDWNKTISRVEKCIDTNFEFIDQFNTFLYTGYAESIAVEGVLKINECLLIPAEAYEIKHFSHGKHFVTYNKPWTFNLFVNEKDQDLIELYTNSIFESHHKINFFNSELDGYLKIFEWAVLMLRYIDVGMKAKLIQLENIPVRDKIRLPHGFKY